MNNLDKIKKELSGNNSKYGFIVPDKYFDELPLKIQENLLREEKEVANPVSVFNLKPRIAYAFSLIIILALIFGSYLFLTHNNHNKLTTEDLIEYAIYFEDDFDESSLLEEINTVEETDLDNGTTDYIIEYLVSDNIDYLTILENY
ncbi:MAG: hypothetical protein JXB17_04115 [Bacteroidales bacterium]|nr:hypothetical protein [Bacteroidales bacterium]